MIRLIPFAPPHFPVLAGWFANAAELVQWGGPGLGFPLDDAAMAAMLAEAAAVPPLRRCWMAEAAGAIVGHAQLAFDRANGNARLARVAIAPEARGRGLAAAMLRPVIDAAFAEAAIARLELNVYCWNVAAIRTYRGLGFVDEGVRRASVRVGDARWDTAIMAMLRPEWEALRAG